MTTHFDPGHSETEQHRPKEKIRVDPSTGNRKTIPISEAYLNLKLAENIQKFNNKKSGWILLCPRPRILSNKNGGAHFCDQ